MAKIRVTESRVLVGATNADKLRSTQTRINVGVTSLKNLRNTQTRVLVGIANGAVRLTTQRLLVLASPPDIEFVGSEISFVSNVNLEWWALSELELTQDAQAQLIMSLEAEASNALTCNQTAIINRVSTKHLFDSFICSQQLSFTDVQNRSVSNTLICNQDVNQWVIRCQFPTNELICIQEVVGVLDKVVDATNVLVFTQQIEDCENFARLAITDNACCFQTLFLNKIFCRNIGNTLTCTQNTTLQFVICAEASNQLSCNGLVNTAFSHSVEDMCCPIQIVELEKVTLGGTASGESDLIALGNVIQLGLTEKFR